MIIDNSHTFIRVLETKTIPKKKTIVNKQLIKSESSSANEVGFRVRTEPKTILENVLPLSEKQRAEFQLFEQLIND